MFNDKVNRIERELKRKEATSAWAFPIDPREISRKLYRKLCPEMSPEEIERATRNDAPLITSMDVDKVRRSLERKLGMAAR
jgi:hypothetical protein